ncbi:membrane protein FAM174B [Hemiscyllium ocellatum]|uniref:membrane protein FAM174B n=1 Tax=Hemiscyllium ocellatum TaxID=170820 RepID=UPI002966C3BB|nr:membrane protein FAM174B [Hemiscyllium ocellatum]
MCGWRLWVLAALLPLAAAMLPEASRSLGPGPGPGPSDSLNQTGSPASPSNGTATAMDSVVPILRHFLTLRNLVLAASAGAFLLIVCLLARVIRSGRKIKKTRKYDIITTPAEKVEMTPLNEDDDDDEDATMFDVKYSR